MSALIPPYVTCEMVSDLNAQLIHSDCVAVHVAPGPALVGLSASIEAPLALEHAQLDSYLQAELLAARVNALLGASDAERTQWLAALQVAV